MSGPGFDPYCLRPQGLPEPVDGPLPPVHLVDSDELPAKPAWVRWVAAALAALFAAVTALSAARTLGGWSLLTDAWTHPLHAAKSAP